MGSEFFSGGVILFLGFVVYGQLRMSTTLARIEERLNFCPTQKQVTDEIAETRRILREELREYMEGGK